MCKCNPATSFSIGLGYKEITSISSDHFKNLLNLKNLYLDSNQLISFDRNALVGLINLELVCLAQNPISVQFPASISKVCDSNPKCQVNLTQCVYQ